MYRHFQSLVSKTPAARNSFLQSSSLSWVNPIQTNLNSEPNRGLARKQFRRFWISGVCIEFGNIFLQFRVFNNEELVW